MSITIVGSALANSDVAQRAIDCAAQYRKMRWLYGAEFAQKTAENLQRWYEIVTTHVITSEGGLDEADTVVGADGYTRPFISGDVATGVRTLTDYNAGEIWTLVAAVETVAGELQEIESEARAAAEAARAQARAEKAARKQAEADAKRLARKQGNAQA